MPSQSRGVLFFAGAAQTGGRVTCYTRDEEAGGWPAAHNGEYDFDYVTAAQTVRARPGRLSALSVP